MQQRDFKDWDEFLNHAIARVSLLNEIVFSQSDCSQVLDFIKSKIHEVGFASTTSLLVNNYPHIFVTFLAKYSAFDDSPGLWTALTDELGINYNMVFNYKWGGDFVLLIKVMGLRDFSELKQANEYYSCIRIHGGIPIYFLADFFLGFIQKAIEKPSLQALTAKDLIETFLPEAYIAKSVKVYIQNSGEIGEDFVEKCLRMARQYAHDPEDILDSKTLGLQAYVVAEYLRVMQVQPTSAKQSRFIKPKIYIDSLGGLALHLPCQPISAEDASREIRFRLSIHQSPNTSVDVASESLKPYKVDIERFSGEILTEELKLPLQLRGPYLQAELYSLKQNEDTEQEQHIQTWRIPFAPSSDEPPLLVFNRYGEMIHWNQSLEADSWVLLYPQTAKVTPNGAGYESESLTALSVDWQGWQAHVWDLSQAHGFYIEQQGQIWAIPIQDSHQPTLVGGSILAVDRNPLETPLYIGEAPRVRLPINAGKDPERQFALWHIFLFPLQASLWQGIEGELHDLSAHVSYSESEGKVEILLSDYLGKNACGVFQIRVHGPLNIQQIFNFRLWDELHIENMPIYVLPGRGIEENLNIHLQVDSHSEVNCASLADSVNLSKCNQKYCLTVGPTVNRADLMLETTCLDQKTIVQVPLYLVIPRLRWNLSLSDGGEIYPWSSQTLHLPAERLVQAPQAGLSLELPGVNSVKDLVELSLARVLDADLNLDSLMTIKGKSDSLRGDRLYFNLLQCLETLKQYKEESLLELVLKIPSPDGNKIVPLPVVDLVRALDIQEVRMEILDETSCLMSWHEHVRLHHRNLMLWSPWMPWDAAKHFAIPDSSKGELIIKDQPLLHLDYRIGFYIAYPWDPIKPKITEVKENTHRALTINPEDQLQLLEQWIAKNPKLEFQYRFERACIFDTIGEISKMEQEISWCFQHIQQSSVYIAMCFYTWLGENSEGTDSPRDLATQSAARIRMFSPELVDKLYQTFPDPNNLVHQAYLDIFSRAKPQFLHPDVCTKILDHETNVQIVVHALKALIDKESEDWTVKDAIHQVLKQLKAGKITMNFAEDLLKEKANSVLEVLAYLQQEQVSDELIVCLSRICPEQTSFLTVGFWYKTPVGWGRVEKILDQQNNALPYVRPDDKSAIIHVTLHPERNPLPAILDREKMIMYIRSNKKLYICTHCREFVTDDRDLIIKGKHQHPGLLMVGIGAGITETKSNQYIYDEEIEFSVEPPYEI